MLIKWETGARNGERGTGNGERGTKVWERVVSGNLHKNDAPAIFMKVTADYSFPDFRSPFQVLVTFQTRCILGDVIVQVANTRMMQIMQMNPPDDWLKTG